MIDKKYEFCSLERLDNGGYTRTGQYFGNVAGTRLYAYAYCSNAVWVDCFHIRAKDHQDALKIGRAKVAAKLAQIASEGLRNAE